ncbi:MAG: M56 family metallopeptidase [Bacteroidota bacterium]
MSWLYYILEANLYLVLFYGFYRLFLQNETFYNLNRYFLLIATVISFALPILQVGPLKQSIEQNLRPISAVSTSIEIAEVNWFYIFYLFIAFCFAIRLSFSIYKIISIWLKAKKRTAGDITLIEVNGESTAFSFFNLLFIHPTLANQPAVLKHEMVHIKQKHSFDVVFFELVQIICWFNPILHFIKKDMKLLHEYIADELTTNSDMQKHEYALFLIQNSFGVRAQPITNQIFNQSILKRRINMLNKKRTSDWARLRLLLAIPLTGAMLCTSTMAFTKDYGYVDLLPEKSNATTFIQENPKVENIKKSDTLRLKKDKKQDQIKFPPPIVKPDKPRKLIKTPPPKQDQVKFPPPIVKPDEPRKAIKTPPPPVEPPPPGYRSKKAKVPPPPVEPPATKTVEIKLTEGEPLNLKKTTAPPPPVEAKTKAITYRMVADEPLVKKVITGDPIKPSGELKEVTIKAITPTKTKN